jgi:hypothetical protein
MKTTLRIKDLVDLMMNTGKEVKIDVYINALFNELEVKTQY